MRSTLIAAVLTAGIIALAAPAASAAETDSYTPYTPTPPSLAGSTASALCVGDVPWINYSVKLTDPDTQAKSHSAYLLISDGTNSVDIPLGDLKHGSLTGTALWPGASVDATGHALTWPGYITHDDGTYTATDDPAYYGWTRGAITAELHVNPELMVPLSYPPASAACASPTALSSESPALATTGGQLPYLAMGLGGTALAAGLAVLVLRRRNARR